MAGSVAEAIGCIGVLLPYLPAFSFSGLAGALDGSLALLRLVVGSCVKSTLDAKVSVVRAIDGSAACDGAGWTDNGVLLG